MSTSHPRVSIVVPCYRQANFLPDAIHSIVLQTYQDWECLIVDDGSPDLTKQVAAQLIAENPGKRIRLISQSNTGLSAARNFGFSQATGEYFLPLDADDALIDTMLEKFVAALDANPNAGIAYSHYHTFGALSEYRVAGPLELPREAYENRLMYASLYRREVFEKSNGYALNLDAYEDWDFWLSALERGVKAILVDPKEPFLLYRVKEQSMFSEAKARHDKLFARIVLNHHKCYQPDEVLKARALLAEVEAQHVPRRANPCVSVIIPCYNQANYLPDALESLSAQTYRDFECIIVDDGSSDDTERVARELIGHYQNLNLRLINKSNGGLSDARNWGILQARGDYILPLDADDKVAPSFLQKTTALLDARADIGIAFSDTQHFGTRNDCYENGPLDLASAAESNPVTATALYRRSLFHDVGGYRTTLSAYEDWDFWLKALKRGWRAERIPEPLFLYRKNDSGLLKQADDRHALFASKVVIEHPDLYDQFTLERANSIAAAIKSGKGVPPPGDLTKVLIFYPDLSDQTGQRFAQDLERQLAELGIAVRKIVTSAANLDDSALLVAPADGRVGAEQIVNVLRREQPTLGVVINSSLGYALTPLIYLNAVECRVGEIVLTGSSVKLRTPDLLKALEQRLDFEAHYSGDDASSLTKLIERQILSALQRIPAGRESGVKSYMDSFNRLWLAPGAVEVVRYWNELISAYLEVSLAKPPEGRFYKRSLFLWGHTLAPDGYSSGPKKITL